MISNVITLCKDLTKEKPALHKDTSKSFDQRLVTSRLEVIFYDKVIHIWSSRQDVRQKAQDDDDEQLENTNLLIGNMAKDIVTFYCIRKQVRAWIRKKTVRFQKVIANSCVNGYYHELQGLKVEMLGCMMPQPYASFMTRLSNLKDVGDSLHQECGVSPLQVTFVVKYLVHVVLRGERQLMASTLVHCQRTW